MREYKFRGKTEDDMIFEDGKMIDKGTWVYGSVIVNGNLPYIVGEVIESDSEYIALEYWYPCDKSTIGQFTGLHDKNGKKIYEGDNIILHQFLFDGGEYENQLIGQVIYDDNQACYCLTNIKNEQVQEYMGYKDDYTNFQKETVPINLFYGMHEESFEVIGNIHDKGEVK